MRWSNILLALFFVLVASAMLAHFLGVQYMISRNMGMVKSDEEFESLAHYDVLLSDVAIFEVSNFENVEVMMGDTFYYRLYTSRGDTVHRPETVTVDRRVLEGAYWEYDTVYVHGSDKKKIARIDSNYYNYHKNLEIHVTGKEQLVFSGCNVELVQSQKPLEVTMNLYSSNMTGLAHILEPMKVKRLTIYSSDGSNVTMDELLDCEELHVTFTDHGTFAGSCNVGSGTITYNDSTIWGNVTGNVIKRMQLVYEPFKKYEE